VKIAKIHGKPGQVAGIAKIGDLRFVIAVGRRIEESNW
jgi:hypothetical protein